MDANPDKVRAVLAGLKDLPAAVASWEIETGEDATGYDAVWVWAVLVKDNVPFAKRRAIRDLVEDEVRAGLPEFRELLVYVSFRTVSELKAR